MKIRCLYSGILLGILSLVFVLLAGETELFQSLEFKVFDYRFKYKPESKIDPNIVLIGIDDNALGILGRWPWKRKIHAALLEALSEYPPACIGYDILFIEPEEDDEALIYTSRLLGNVVYAGYKSEEDGVCVYPIEGLISKDNYGFANLPPDKDGVIRKLPLIIKDENKIYPSFVLQVLCRYLDMDFKNIKVEFGKAIKVPGLSKEIPIDADGNMWINYAGEKDAFGAYSFPQVLSWKGSEKTRFLGNKLILIGLTATGTVDQGTTPLAVGVPLSVVQADAINTILCGNYLQNIPEPLSFLIVVLMAALGSLVNIYMRPFRAAIISLLILAAFFVSNFLFFSNNILLEFLKPVSAYAVPYLLITIYRYGWEEREKRWIKKVFSHYLSSEVINEIVSKPSALKLGGELREATVLFLDLRNFTNFCENKSPTEVVELLNKTFNWMTEIILKNGGMLDKYIGDAIMAIFGAPGKMSVPEQVNKAVKSALEILKRWQESKMMNLGIGIGINTGTMVVGNMGSSYIFNYTAIGDEVNVAMRVLELTGEYEASIIVTESVYKWIKDTIKTEPLGDAHVKGRKEPVRLYAVEG